MEHQIQGNDFTEDEISQDAKDIVAQYTYNPGNFVRRQGESMVDFVDRSIKQYKLLKLKDPDVYVSEVTRTLVMVQQARTPMGVSLDLQRLVRKGEMRFEEAAKELVERYAKIHKKERQHLRISSRAQEDTNTPKKDDQGEMLKFCCNIRDLQAVRTGGIMIDGVWRPLPPGYRFDTYKWSNRRQEFRLRTTRLTSTELVVAAKKEAKKEAKEAEKLAKKAAKEAEKLAKKAEKEAAKEAEKAKKKAEKEAAKKAEKAKKKAEKEAASMTTVVLNNSTEVEHQNEELTEEPISPCDSGEEEEVEAITIGSHVFLRSKSDTLYDATTHSVVGKYVPGENGEEGTIQKE